MRLGPSPYRSALALLAGLALPAVVAVPVQAQKVPSHAAPCCPQPCPYPAVPGAPTPGTPAAPSDQAQTSPAPTPEPSPSERYKAWSVHFLSSATALMPSLFISLVATGLYGVGLSINIVPPFKSCSLPPK